MKNKRHSRRDREWPEANKHKLPELKPSPRTRSVGTLNDLADVADNPRQGSDVYIGTEFMILTGHTKFSKLPGAPTMPIKQWHRWKLIKESLLNDIR